MNKDKTYYGYKPKQTNVVKLNEYMRVKNQDKRDNSIISKQATSPMRKKAVLKNKKF